MNVMSQREHVMGGVRRRKSMSPPPNAGWSAANAGWMEGGMDVKAHLCENSEEASSLNGTSK
jgi:hypothetical protein